MSFQAYLKVAGKQYPVDSASFTFFRDYASSAGKPPEPTTGVQCGGIVVTLELGDDDKIIEWMADSYKKLDGSIIYNKSDEASSQKELTFKKARCSSYSDSFSATSNGLVLATITIAPQEVSLGGATWKPEEAE